MKCDVRRMRGVILCGSVVACVGTLDDLWSVSWRRSPSAALSPGRRVFPAR